MSIIEKVKAALVDEQTTKELDELAVKVSGLDTTVGQMATSLANLIRLLEQRKGQR